MSFKKWLSEGKIKSHKFSDQEIRGILELVERDVQNATITDLSSDWRFSIAYNAVLNLATIPFLLSGYRTVPSKGGHHYMIISSLVETLGNNQNDRMQYFNTCRSKRHASTYDSISVISEDDVNDLLDEIEEFKVDIINWLKQTHPSILS